MCVFTSASVSHSPSTVDVELLRGGEGEGEGEGVCVVSSVPLRALTPGQVWAQSLMKTLVCHWHMYCCPVRSVLQRRGVPGWSLYHGNRPIAMATDPQTINNHLSCKIMKKKNHRNDIL